MRALNVFELSEGTEVAGLTDAGWCAKKAVHRPNWAFWLSAAPVELAEELEALFAWSLLFPLLVPDELEVAIARPELECEFAVPIGRAPVAAAAAVPSPRAATVAAAAALAVKSLESKERLLEIGVLAAECTGVAASIAPMAAAMTVAP